MPRAGPGLRPGAATGGFQQELDPGQLDHARRLVGEPAAARHHQVRDRHLDALAHRPPGGEIQYHPAGQHAELVRCRRQLGRRAGLAPDHRLGVGDHLARHVERVHQARQELHRAQARRRTVEAPVERAGAAVAIVKGVHDLGASEVEPGDDQAALAPGLVVQRPLGRDPGRLGHIDPVEHHVGGAHQPVNVVGRHAVPLDQYLDLRIDRPGPGCLHLGLVAADIPHVGGLPVEIVQLVLTRLAQDKALRAQPHQRHDRRPADTAAARNQDPHGAQRALLLPAERRLVAPRHLPVVSGLGPRLAGATPQAPAPGLAGRRPEPEECDRHGLRCAERRQQLAAHLGDAGVPLARHRRVRAAGMRQADLDRRAVQGHGQPGLGDVERDLLEAGPSAQEGLVLQRAGLQQAQRGCAAKRILLGVAGELLRQALCHAEWRQRPEYARMHGGGAEPRGHGGREEQLQVEAVPVLCGRLGAEAHQRVQLGLGGPVHQLHRRGAGGDRGHPVDLGPVGEHRQAEAQPPRGGLQAFDHRAGDGIGAVAGAIHLAAAQSAQPALGHLVRRRRPGQQRDVSRDIAGRPPADLGVKAERPGAHAQVGDNGAAGQVALASAGIERAQHLMVRIPRDAEAPAIHLDAPALRVVR